MAAKFNVSSQQLSFPVIKMSEKFSTSLFKVKLFDPNIDYLNNNGQRTMWLLADCWGLKLFNNRYNIEQSTTTTTTTSTKSTNRVWLWKLDCYRLEFRSNSNRFLYVKNFSSRFEIKLQFIDNSARQRFLCQCEKLCLLRKLKISSITHNSSFSSSFNKRGFQKENLIKIFTKFFQNFFWTTKKQINFHSYEPLYSPFEQISF